MKTNKYEMLKNKHQEEFNKFPIGFAFNKQQFVDQMNKLGLTEKDIDKIVPLNGGGFIRKSDVIGFSNLIEKFDKEMKEAIDKDKDGTGFIKDMFYYELGNHEYIITCDLTETLDSLDLTMKDLKSNPKLRIGLNLAKKEYLGQFNKSRDNLEHDRGER